MHIQDESKLRVHQRSTFICRTSMISNFVSTAVRSFCQGDSVSPCLKMQISCKQAIARSSRGNLGHQCGYSRVGLSLSLWHLEIPSRAESEPQQRDMTLCMSSCWPKYPGFQTNKKSSCRCHHHKYFHDNSASIHHLKITMRCLAEGSLDYLHIHAWRIKKALIQRCIIRNQIACNVGSVPKKISSIGWTQALLDLGHG